MKAFNATHPIPKLLVHVNREREGGGRERDRGGDRERRGGLKGRVQDGRGCKERG